MGFETRLRAVIGIAAGLWLMLAGAQPVGTAFTYQGELKHGGTVAEGPYDFHFELFDAGGLLIGGPLILDDVAVAAGVFTVELDFGAGPFTGNEVWLAIAVREGASSGVFVDLLPRQKITAVPYALQAELVAMGSVGAAEVDYTEVQIRVSDSCPADHYLRAIGPGGEVDCQPDADTINTNAAVLDQGILDTDRYDAYDDLLASNRLDNNDGNDLLQRWQLDQHFQGRSGALTVPGNAFDRQGTFCIADRNPYGIYFVAGTGVNCKAIAAISLPDGVSVNSLSCHVYDNDSSPGALINVSFCDMLLSGTGTACSPSSDSIDSPNDQLLTRVLGDIIVDNSTTGYYLEAGFGTVAPVGSNVSLTGCIVRYKVQ